MNMDINDTSPAGDSLQEPAKLTAEDVRRIAETLPALAAWLRASPVAVTLPALLAPFERERQENDARKQATPDERDIADRMKDADDLICVYANNSGTKELPGVAQGLYDAAGHLIQYDDAMHQRVGYVLALDAFLASPGVIDQAIRTLRQKLVESDPDLALLRR